MENREGHGFEESAVAMVKGLVTFKKPEILSKPYPESPEKPQFHRLQGLGQADSCQ